MATLLSSRWADAPAEETIVEPTTISKEGSVIEPQATDAVQSLEEEAALNTVADEQGIVTLQEEETSPEVVLEDKEDEAQPTNEDKTFPGETGQGEARASATPAIEVSDVVVEPKEEPKETSFDTFRLEPSRFRKTIAWNSKKVVINILDLNYAALGLPVPLSPEEVQQRIQHFQDEGYNTSGFDSLDDDGMHNKPIYYEELDIQARPTVNLPDLHSWRDYMQAVTEAKLAALGVSVGDEDPSFQEVARQSPAPFTQPFSPPLPTGSAMSIGRPAFVRGHSHTMSVAAPISPMNGPFGHMHRHSTFHGFSPMQAGLQSFSPQPRMASPALAGLRTDMFRGPGTPLQQSMTPEAEYARLQQAGLIPPTPTTPIPQRNEPIGVLPELPEDEDEELSDRERYMPPHKRAHVNEDIAVPTPRGHRHNISEGLEREVMHLERAEDNKRPKLNGFGQAPQLFGQISDQVPAEKDPLSGDFAVQNSSHAHKKSGSRLNVSAPAFTFNPQATFQPGSTAFTFPSTVPNMPTHTRQASSGNFNVAAPEFQPGQFSFGMSIAEEAKNEPLSKTTDFSFSTAGPVFRPDAAEFEIPTPDRNIVDELPSIFGKIDIPEIIKPVKKSKAIAIIHPSSKSGTDVEDADGRIDHGLERQKRSRIGGGGSGDEIPLFAEPSLPVGPVLPSQPADEFPVIEKPLPALPQDDEREAILEPAPKHSLTSSLSALAKPWQPAEAVPEALKASSVSSLEDGEVEEVEEVQNAFTFPPKAPMHHSMPSFAEIDAVMQHLNDDEPRAISPIDQAVYEPQEGVQYISTWPRSDAPSPSPKRRLASPPPLGNGNDWPHVNRLNKAQGPPSDWSDMLSPGDDHKLQARSSFFDDRVDDVIGRVLEDRLRPFEQALQSIQLSLHKRSPSFRRPSKHRSSSAIESDADDEDDSEAQQRPISRGREQKLGHIKAIVLEALREQSPQRQQATHDIADLHSVLADMKVSFARAASSSLDLDDIRQVVEDVTRQSQALVAIEPERSADDEHQRQLTNLKDRLDETLSSSLEQANRTHEAEQREAETRRMLKLAEEELSLLRDTSRDDTSRIKALEEDRVRLVDQIEDAEDAQSKAEAISDGLKAEVEALNDESKAFEATIEEYRLSSDKWRAEADQHELARQELESRVASLESEIIEHKTARQELESTIVATNREVNEHKSVRLDLEKQAITMVEQIAEHRLAHEQVQKQSAVILEEHRTVRQDLEHKNALMERQLGETQDSGSSMRRRLEKLHSDLATAMGQLVSEKGRWQTSEESYKLQYETLLSQKDSLNHEKQQLQEEVVVLRGRVSEFDNARETFEGLQTSNTSFNDMIAGLRSELAEAQQLAARYKHESTEAKESGRIEVQRMRQSLEQDVEAANHRVNMVRAELENEIGQVRSELDAVKLEADITKEKHALLLQAEADAKRDIVEKIGYEQSRNIEELLAKHNDVLIQAQNKHNTIIDDLTQIHNRKLTHAVEDKERSEYLLNERLALADAKLQHFQDRVLHLEERVEVAKSAAQAAVMNAQSSKTVSSPRSTLPERVSPQALRESILVLQEQLQDRESRIESLEQKLRIDGPAKVKERDTEIAWLRELLTVRGEELTELVNTLSKPTFDRDTVRDTAIRIRANLQMEQQEKERSTDSNNFPIQAIASLSSFATPKAAQLTSAFNKWRSSMESTALRSRPPSRTRSYTPSRVTSGGKPNYGTSGLMTPPASNLRNSPTPDASISKSAQVKAINMNEVESRSREEPAGPTTPTLLENDNYDDDAEDRPNAGDDDLDVADSQPPAFRSLEDELAEPAEAGAEEV